MGLMAAGMACAQTTPKSALLALSKQDHTLSIIDPATLKVVARVPVGDDPHEVVASADGKTAYVSNYGFGAFHTLAVIDLVGQKQMPFIDLGALKRAAWVGVCRGQGLFYGGGCEGDWKLRSGRRARSTGSWAPGRTGRTCCMCFPTASGF